MANDNIPSVEEGSTTDQTPQSPEIPNYNPNYVASVIDDEGETDKYSYNPIDPESNKNFGGDGSSHSVIARQGAEPKVSEPATREIPQRAGQESRDIWSINTREGDKPTEILGDSIKSQPDDPELRKAMNKYWESKGTRELDSKDELGRRQNNASAYRMAELKKISNFVEQQVERIKQPGNLTDKEKAVLLEKHMTENSESYTQKKAELEGKGVAKEDIELLLRNHPDFKDEINKYERSISRRTLREDEIKAVATHYKKELVKEHSQDVEARDFQSAEARRLERDEAYKQQNDIEQEKAHQNDFANNLPERIPVVENPPITIPEDPQEVEDPKEKERNERDLQKKLLIAGALSGGATGALVGAVPQVALASTILVAGSAAGSFISRWAENRLIKKLSTEQNPEEITKLEKRLKLAGDVRKWCNRGLSFFGGFAGGYKVASFISTRFFGGQGLLSGIGKETVPSQPPTQDLPKKGPDPSSTGVDPNAPSATPGIGETPQTEVLKSIDPSQTGLVENGRVKLPGSTWDGNFIDPEIGGTYASGANWFNNEIAKLGLNVSKLNEMGVGTQDIHRLMYDAQQQFYNGQTPVFENLLQSAAANDVPSATNILSLIN